MTRTAMTEEDWTKTGKEGKRYAGMNAAPSYDPLPEKAPANYDDGGNYTSGWKNDNNTEPVSDREHLLLGAIEAITKQRNNEYGPPTQDFDRTAKLWTEAFRHKLKDGEVFQPHEVAIFQILLKISRSAWSPEKMDHWLDIAGYAGCGWETVVEEKKL